MRVILYDGYYVKKYDDGRNVSIAGDCVADAEVTAWIANGNTPEPAFTDEQLAEYAKQSRIAEIDARFAEIDMLKLRPLSELMLNATSEFALNKLSELEAEAEALRAERAGLI